MQRGEGMNADGGTWRMDCQDGSEWVSGLRFLAELAECFGDEKM